MRRIKSLVIAVMFFTVPMMVHASAVGSNLSKSELLAISTAQIKMLVLAQFGLNNPIVDVIGCESGFRQFDSSGAILESPTADYGIMQINESWLPKAKELGFDIFTTQGNLDMGQYILKMQGLRPWVCASKLGLI